MRFKESVRNCAYYKYADFKGRSSRSEFWWFMGALLVANAIAILGATFAPTLASAAVGGLSLVMLCPYAAALFRRLHDLGLSGWWAGAAFIASLLTSSLAALPELEWTRFVSAAAFGLLFLAALFPGQKTENRYGPAPEA